MPVTKSPGSVTPGVDPAIMTAAIASLISENPIVIESVDAVNTSFPNFWELFAEIGGRFAS